MFSMRMQSTMTLPMSTGQKSGTALALRATMRMTPMMVTWAGTTKTMTNGGLTRATTSTMKMEHGSMKKHHKKNQSNSNLQNLPLNPLWTTTTRAITKART